MTARQKRTTAKKTAKKPPPAADDRDLEAELAGPPVTYEPANVVGQSGDPVQILAPRLAGRTLEEHDRDALKFIQAVTALDDWKPLISAEIRENRLEVLADACAMQIVSRVLDIAASRFSEDEITSALVERGASGGLEAITATAKEKQRESLLKEFHKSEAADLVLKIERSALASLAFEARAQGGSPETLRKRIDEAYRTRYFVHVGASVKLIADHVARLHLEAINPDTATLQEILGALNPSEDARLTIATNQLNAAMRRGLLRDSLDVHEETISYTITGSGRGEIKARIEVDEYSLAATVERERQEDVLDNIRTALLGWKKQSAALLKTHLDLTNKAYETPTATGKLPIFEYRLSDALERQGYKRHKRGFHHDTMRGLRERIEALYAHRVMAWRMKKRQTGEQVFARTPYWIIQEEYYVRQGALDFDALPAIARADSQTTYTSVLVQAGAWWEYAQMREYRIAIPASILQLPTDGRGNRSNHWALLLASYLAVHVRVNQQKAAGKKVHLRVGKLLEGADIITLAEFQAIKDRTEAKRVRDYLLNTDGTGALATLDELGAFRVDILDEEDYFATGRGWKETFWEARLAVDIPALGIRKRMS